jgi:putative spermidine/putrescine transport system substrate-binding protein
MEDYQEQEYEFFRRLEEERVDRRRLLRRGLAVGAGLTVLTTPTAALATRRRVLATPPLRAKDISMNELVKQAKKEGRLNTIALPPDWANYGEMMSTFSKKYDIPITNASPEASSGDEVQAVISLKGQSRAPDVLDVGPSFAISGANQGLYAKYYVTSFKKIPRAMRDNRGFWIGDYWGVIGFGANLDVVKQVPADWSDLMKPEYKGKVALNDDPRKANAAFSGVFAASLANGGSLSDIQPGIDFFAKLKQIGNFVPINVTGQTVASGQTPVTIDWDYLQFGYTKSYKGVNWHVGVPKSGVYGGYYCQAISATAPHPFAARLWEEFLYSDQGQLLWLKGYAHPALFADLAARKVIPSSLLKALPDPGAYAGVKFASLKQIDNAKQKVAEQWGPKVLGA